LGKRNTYKYEEYLQKVREIHNIECPFENAENLLIEAFRWVDEPMVEENFIPTPILQALQGKKIREFPIGDERNCTNHGLSLFISQKKAKDRFNSLHPRIQQQLAYTRIAKGTIEEDDGVNTSSDKNGHFTFFEYEGVELVNKFEIISQL